MKQAVGWRLTSLLVALVVSIGWGADVAYASEPCNPPNVIPQPVCDMDSFYGTPPRQLPVGWNAFVLSGDPNYYQDDHTFFGGPNLTMASNGGTFKAGIYTQVSVTPGTGYRASINWGAPNAPDLFGRQLGIDPTGGTDPTAPTVIWGPMHWGEGRILNYPPPDVNIDVRARAVAETMTVFFSTDHPQSSGDNIILVDAIALYPDDSAPAVELPPTPAPTDTPTPEPPPVEVAVAAAPAVEPTLPPTDTPAPTETPLPTETPTLTPSPTPTNTPTPLPTATWTPLPPATVESSVSVVGVQVEAVQVVQAVPRRGFLFVAIVGFGSAGLLGGAWVWLRRGRW